MEQEIRQLAAAIQSAEAEAARERGDADALVSRMRESGTDLTERDNFAKIDEAYKRADAQRDAVAALRDQRARLLEIVGRQTAPATQTARTDPEQPRGLAHRFTNSPQFREMQGSGVLRASGARVNMPPVEDALSRNELRNGLRTRTTFDNSANIGSGLLVPDYTGDMIEQYVRKVRFLDVITIGDTDTDTVDWVVENPRTDSAAPAPYGTAVGESAYGFSHKQTTVQRIGHFVPATKGILMDAGQTHTLLSSRLVNGLQRQVEQQVLSGNGTAPNLLGVLSASGLNSQARGTDTRLDCAHKAITAVRVATQMEYDPTVICLSPQDYENLILDKQTTGNYTFGSPTDGKAPTIWGLVPVVSTLFQTGSPLVGDFKAACTMWLREGVTVSVSDQHMDFFLKGLVAIMAETRVAFAVQRPTAITQITGF
ncbi:hypothetical protein GCM10009760_25890 [Kitasatospora kazusensis]|uniref:Phage capsid-like C-terminal domain-containing protein n=1 Tax=Kitasatospora kazusensis TaxID=407974 RepID=A0ABN2ZFU7_9ACTN